MDANYFAVTVGENSGFHAIDRALYSVLAVELWHDPLLAVQILSLWLWLEQLGFRKFVHNILSMPFGVINELANEAITCLSCIKNPEIMAQAETTELPLTSRFLKRKICILILVRNRDVVLTEISKIVEVCAISLRDAIGEAAKSHRARDLLHKLKTLAPVVAIEESLINSFANLGLGFGGRNCSSSSNSTGLPSPVPVQPVIRRSSNLGFTGNGGLSRNGGSNIPPEERTMFVTFSKGFPVNEAELLDFFHTIYGDCIESVHMQKVRQGEQPLYCRVVFGIPGVIDMVLNGINKAKFTINGKHVWMRKFIPRITTSSAATSG